MLGLHSSVHYCPKYYHLDGRSCWPRHVRHIFLWQLSNVARVSQSKCGPFFFGQDVVTSANLGQFRFIWFVLGWRAAMLCLAFGPDLGNRSRPPKCHHSTRYVGWMNVFWCGPDLGHRNVAMRVLAVWTIIVSSVTLAVNLTMVAH